MSIVFSFRSPVRRRRVVGRSAAVETTRGFGSECRRAPRRERGDWMQAVLTFVEATQGDRRKAHRPQTLVDFFEANGFAGQCVADKQMRPRHQRHPFSSTRRISTWPAYSSGGSRRGSRRGDGLIQHRGHRSGERLMRPLLVVFAAEARSNRRCCARAVAAGGRVGLRLQHA